MTSLPNNITLVKILIVVLIIIASFIIAKIISINIKRSLKEKVRQEHLDIISKLINYVIVIIGFLASLSLLKINLSGLLVAGGIVGLVIGFASQSIVGNLISGLFLMVERPIKIGDQVNINDTMGVVEDIRIISTTIRTWDGYNVRMPNERVFTSNITNFVAHPARRFEYVVGIRYSDDADRAVSIIADLLNDHPLVLVNPEYQAFVDNLGDNSVNIMVRIWAPSSVWYSVKMEMLWKIKKTLEDHGIEIAFPQRVVWFGDKPEKGGKDKMTTHQR